MASLMVLFSSPERTNRTEVVNGRSQQVGREEGGNGVRYLVAIQARTSVRFLSAHTHMTEHDEFGIGYSSAG